MKPTEAFVICDTGLGTTDPRPLLHHVYPSEDEAKYQREYRRLSERNFPIIKVTIAEGAGEDV